MIAILFTLFNFAAMSMRAFNPTAFEQYKKMANAEVTSIIGVSEMCDLMGVILGAVLMTRLGRKPLILFGFFAASIATLTVPFTDNMIYLSAALGAQQLSSVWIYQVTTVRLSYVFC